MTDATTPTNGFDPDVVQNLVGSIESLHDELATERGEYMQRCRQVRDHIKDVVQAAKDEHGVPKKAIKLLVKQRKVLAELDAIEQDLEPDDGHAFRQLEAALGDYGGTPLGQAAKMAAAMNNDERKRGGRRKRKDTDGDEATA